MKLIEGKNSRCCSRCKELKHFDEFHKDKSKKYGINSRCKDCVKINTKERWKRKRRTKIVTESIERNLESFRDKLFESKYCSRCDKYKSWDEFQKDATKPKGIGSWCKECDNEVHRQKRREESDVVYHEKCLECDKSIQRPRSKFCSKICKDTYNHREIYNYKFTNNYRGKNPKNFIKSLLHKKVRKKLDIDYMMEIYNNQDGKCAISGIEMTYITGEGKVPTNMSIDRINNNKGYEKGNIQLACLFANRMKWSYSQNQLVKWCKNIVEFNNPHNNSDSNLKMETKKKNRGRK